MCDISVGDHRETLSASLKLQQKRANINLMDLTDEKEECLKAVPLNSVC